MSILAGKSIALAGLDLEQLPAVSSAIDQAGAEWQAFSRADAAKLRAFDAIVCSSAFADAAAEAGAPALIVGTVAALAEWKGGDCCDFVTAPVRGDEVVLRLHHLMLGEAPKARQTHEVPVVLAADDDPTTTAIVRAVVTQNAMTCEVARDGREAVERAREIVPDAIVLDVNMPYRDGFEVLAALRSDPRTNAVPVLMLTSVQQEADVVRGFRLGADDYVIKPFNPMELLARIKRLVRRG
jgi:CheY-like chemotaxis protein